jgi:hypothetical protein
MEPDQGEEMSRDSDEAALEAIEEEAQRLLNLPPEKLHHDLEGGLQLIMAIARYKADIRSVEEIRRAHKK